MTRRLALLVVLGAVSACDAPSQAVAPALAPSPREFTPMLSAREILERSEQCAAKAREIFRREWEDGIRTAGKRQTAAEFAGHYNTKLDTCFYLVTVVRRDAGEEIFSRTLLDINENEIYGNYLGPPAGELPPGRRPDACDVQGMYCASGREWEVLVGPYMED